MPVFLGSLTTLEPKKRRSSASASRFLGSTDMRFRNAMNRLFSATEAGVIAAVVDDSPFL